jgi:hypothetical protein
VVSAPDLSPEDAAALARLREHLREQYPAAPSVARVEHAIIRDGWVCTFAVGEGVVDDVLLCRVTRATPGEALCEAARRIGVAL